MQFKKEKKNLIHVLSLNANIGRYPKVKCKKKLFEFFGEKGQIFLMLNLILELKICLKISISFHSISK